MRDISLGYILRGTIFQYILFLSIPVVWWAVKWRKKVSLPRFFGLYIPKQVDRRRAVIMIGLYCVFWTISHLPVITQFTQPSANAYLNRGTEAIIPALFVAFIQNGLCEEIFFRGFVLKRLKTVMGENGAIALQAVLFGLVHNLLEWDVPFATHVVIFLPACLGGYLLGYMDEKVFKGSILPSVALHGIGNSIINLSRAFGFWL